MSTKLRIWVTLTTVVWVGAISLNVSPYLLGPDDWRWPYALPGQPLRLLWPVLVLLLYVGLGGYGAKRLGEAERPLRRTLFLYLSGLWLAVPLIQSSMLAVNSPNAIEPLFFRTISADASGVFSVGSTINDSHTFLNHYPELMPSLPVHPQRYPPGLPMMFYLTRKVLEQTPAFTDTVANYLRLYQCHDVNLMRLSNPTIASALLQMVLPLVSGLIIFPLYGLARWVGNPRMAAWTVLFYPLVPSFVLWSGVWDQFYPLLTVTAWFLLAWALQTKRGWLAVSGGLVLGLAITLTFGMVAMLAPMGLWAFAWVLLRLKNWREFGAYALLGSYFTIGLALPWLLYDLFYTPNVGDIWRVAMGFHFSLGRNNWLWLFYHFYDFALFLGIPLAILFGLSLIRGVRHWQEAGMAGLRLFLFPLAFGMALLILNLSGTSQGEVARVWLFLSPFAVLTAVFYLDKATATPSYWPQGVIWVVVLLASQLLAFNAFLRILTTGVPDRIIMEREFVLPAGTAVQPTQLGPAIALVGHTLGEETAVSIAMGQSLTYTLYWQAQTPIHQPYTIFNHLLAPNGQLIAQQDNMPRANQWPTTCWVPQEVVADPYVLAIPNDIPAGDYSLVTGMYWLETGERLNTTGAYALPNQQVWVQTITIQDEEN